jgi:ferric-dicitrate binding protein FerR (iron transport regulator)
MSYTHYQAEDFAADEFFIRWVKTPDSETEAFWQEWIQTHPAQADTIREAKELVGLLETNKDFPTIGQINRMRQHIHSRTGRASKIISMRSPQPSQIPMPWYQSWQKLAAVFLAFLVCSALLWIGIIKVSKVEYRTAYGQIQTIQLPDGSTVTLNANSALRYSRTWDSTHDREVWLEGEAFFDVKHLKNHNRFLVHTQDKLSVEVLGTTFNVFERKSGTRVVLQTGKVKLTVQQGQKQEQVLMQPGEQVELVEKTGGYAKKKVDPQQALAWKAHKLVFDNTSMAEIVAVLEENYGLNVTIASPELLQKKLVGSAPTHDVDVFLSALAKSFNLKINRNGKEVSIAGP